MKKKRTRVLYAGVVVFSREFDEALAVQEVEDVLAALREDLLSLATRVDEDGLFGREHSAGRGLGGVDAVAPEPHLADERDAEGGGGREDAEVDAGEGRVPQRVHIEAKRRAVKRLRLVYQYSESL